MSKSLRKHLFARAGIVAVSSLAASIALAQTAGQPRDPNMPDPRNVPPEKIEPQQPGTTGSTGSGATLSDRLERTEGVIAPPTSTTPDMRVTPPVADPGTTPVIRPPGAPGDPVQPR